MKYTKKRVALLFYSALIFSTSLYVLPAGYPQPGHMLLFLFLAPLLLKSKELFFSWSERLLIVFFIYIFSVNLVYWLTFRDLSFIISSIYWLYGILIFFSARQLFLTQPELAQGISWSLVLALTVLSVLALVGGESFFWDKRLIGTFNDPNQMSYWLLCIFVSSLLVTARPAWLNANSVLVIFSIILFLVFLGGSRSGLFGLITLLIGLLGWLRQPNSTKSEQAKECSGLGLNSPRRTLLILGVAFFTLTVLIFIFYQINDAISVAIRDVIHRIGQESIYFQLHIRGYTRLVDFPEYLLFGAGQGMDSRFIEPVAGYTYEVHSSIISPLFYYGIIGFGLLYTSFYLMARDRLEGWQWLVFAAPFVYGLFTYGLRTPVFWIMLASLYTIPLKADRTDSKTAKTVLS